MKIGVIGAGRLGICFALLCESVGHEVQCSDVRNHYVSDLNNRQLYSNEPEVEDLLLRSTKLRATTSNSNVIKSSDVIFTFVPTFIILTCLPVFFKLNTSIIIFCNILYFKLEDMRMK